MELNPESDLEIDVANLSTEFRKFPVALYRYCVYKAQIEAKLDITKAKLEETRAIVYKRIKSDTSIKHTEKSVEAEIDTDAAVLEAQTKFIRAQHDASTWAGAVDSMKAKKDMLMQLGADARKER